MKWTPMICENCKKMFKYPGFGSLYCPLCREQDEKNRSAVKTFLRTNGNANMYEISMATGVPEEDVKQYLRDGMLEIPPNSKVFIKCENCGCDIRSGRWCPSCASKMSIGQGSYVGVGDYAKPASGKMRFLGQDEEKRSNGRMRFLGKSEE